MAEWVNWGGRLTPRSLIDHLRRDEICPECGGLGEYYEQIDSDRHLEMVPCHRCRYCKECKKWVNREGHEHA